MLQLHNYYLSNYGITNKKGRHVPLTLALKIEGKGSERNAAKGIAMCLVNYVPR